MEGNGEIEKLTIKREMDGARVTIEDKSFISGLMEASSSMELKSDEGVHPMQYWLYATTDDYKTIELIVGEEGLFFGGSYEVKGENQLLHQIEELQMPWSAPE
ncbi:hypothetical protein [Thalassobacillus hwangdonensis]|uniref:hypothetical protein n=1 Tax=Thalassobacillus hwangdonensis TaxID=546108 RepID=UPI0036DA53FF